MAQKQILESIRDLIGSTADDEVLELTEVLEEGKPATDKPAAEPKPVNLFEKDLAEEDAEIAAKKEPEKTAEESAPQDVLSEIDALLSADQNSSITTPDSDIELAEHIEPKVDPAPEPVIEPAPEPEIQNTENVAPAPVTQGDDTMSNTEQLISEQSAHDAEAALKTLSEVVQKASAPKIDSVAFRNGDTVEDLVTTMMKPILKEWLDTNLPKLVQSIVEKEIKRLMPQ